MTDEDGKEKRFEQRSAGTFVELDPDAPTSVAWHAMPALARMNACLAAALAGREMKPAAFRYDWRQGVVFVVLENRIDPEKRDVIIRRCEVTEAVRTKGRAALGAKWIDVERACACTSDRATRILGALR
jgi:hypothetical protein